MDRDAKDMSGAKADTDPNIWRLPIPAPERARMERTRVAAGHLMLVGTRRERVVDLIWLWLDHLTSDVEVLMWEGGRKIREGTDDAQT